jgi:hypothetical protein
MSIASIDSSAFRHHVDRHLEPLRVDLSAKRREAWTQLILRSTISVVLLVAIAGSGWWTHRPEDDFYWWMLAFVVFAFGVGLFVWCALPWFVHRDRLKHDVLTRLVPFFGDFSYLPEASLTPGEFENFGLLPQYNDHSAEDEVTGSHRGVPLRAADLILRYEYTPRRSGSSSLNKEIERVFKGVLLALELPRPAPCDVLLGTPDFFKGRFAIRDESGWQRVELPHGGLEAWTRDRQACDRLVNADLVDRAAALVSRGGVRSLRMAWHGKTLAMLIDFGEDFFELPFRGEIDFRRFGEIVESQLTRLTRVIDLLGLPPAGEPDDRPPRSLDERMRPAAKLEADFETQDRGCLPMVVFTAAVFCAYLWLLVDVVRPLGALGLAFVFGILGGFGLATVLFGERKRRSAWLLVLIGLVGISPALPDQTLDRLPGGQWVKSLKLIN